MSGDEDFDQVMAELTRQFISELAGHEEAIRTALDGALRGEEESLRALAARAHRLSGLGRTFGHPAISELGEAVELAAEAGGADLDAKVARLLDAIALARAS